MWTDVTSCALHTSDTHSGLNWIIHKWHYSFATPEMLAVKPTSYTFNKDYKKRLKLPSAVQFLP